MQHNHDLCSTEFKHNNLLYFSIDFINPHKKYADIFGPPALQPGFVKWLLIRGFVGCSAVTLLFEAFERLPLGDANALSSNVVWTSVIGFLILREKIHWIDISAIPINVIGILLLAQPSFLFGNAISYKGSQFFILF